MIKFENNLFHIRNQFFINIIEISRGKYLLPRYWGHPLKKFRESTPLQKIGRGSSEQIADF